VTIPGDVPVDVAGRHSMAGSTDHTCRMPMPVPRALEQLFCDLVWDASLRIAGRTLDS